MSSPRMNAEQGDARELKHIEFLGSQTHLIYSTSHGCESGGVAAGGPSGHCRNGASFRLSTALGASIRRASEVGVQDACRAKRWIGNDSVKSSANNNNVGGRACREEEADGISHTCRDMCTRDILYASIDSTLVYTYNDPRRPALNRYRTM